MIAHDAMFAPLLDTCPSFAPVWDDLVAEWRDEPALPLYPVLQALDLHVWHLLKADGAAEIDGIFRVVELWLTEGDASVKQATEVGFLETLKHKKGGDKAARAAGLKALRRRFGPATAKAWETI